MLKMKVKIVACAGRLSISKVYEKYEPRSAHATFSDLILNMTFLFFCVCIQITLPFSLYRVFTLDYRRPNAHRKVDIEVDDLLAVHGRSI